MNEGPPGAQPLRHDPIAALRQASFVFYTLSRVSSTTANTLLQTTMAWHVYHLSGSALNLGLLGLARFLPAFCLSLVGGAVADSFNRRTIIRITQCVPLVCSSSLAIATLSGGVRLEMIYALVLAIGFASAFEGPARAALLPSIVRPETFANAVTINSTLQTLGQISGPALAGGMIALAGVGWAYALNASLVFIGIVMLMLVRYRPVAEGSRRLTVTAIKQGIGFVRSRQEVLGPMALDMLAVIFAGAEALLPVYAADILHVGPSGYGLLTASLPVGAFLMSLTLVMRPPVVNTGKVLILTVAVYGLTTVGFGLSRTFVASLVLYSLVGGLDQIGVVMRNTTIQLATPDELRGRVSAVGQVFVGASNQLGAAESGFLAALTSATFAVVSGGIAAILVAGFIAWRMPLLYNYKIVRRRPIEVLAEEPAAGGGT